MKGVCKGNSLCVCMCVCTDARVFTCKKKTKKRLNTFPSCRVVKIQTGPDVLAQSRSVCLFLQSAFIYLFVMFLVESRLAGGAERTAPPPHVSACSVLSASNYQPTVCVQDYVIKIPKHVPV